MLIQKLMETPGTLSPSSKFTVANGLIYMASGALLLVWPGVLQALMFETEFIGREEALIRVLGMTVMFIGWFYVFGGRSGGKQFVASTVVDRIFVVPVVLIPLAIAGVFPVLLGLFAILDPVLGVVAWYLMHKENQGK
jgi:hypothetical protein